MNVKLIYIEGKNNIVSDYFSRNFESVKEWKVINCSLLSLEAFNNSELISIQQNDIELISVFNFLCAKLNKDHVFEQYRKYLHDLFIEYGVLKINFRDRKLIVVPEELRHEILNLHHSKWFSGHFGSFKTLERIYEKFWWPNLKTDVINFIDSCEICLAVKSPNRKKGRLGIRSWPHTPLELISIDFLVNLPITKKGNCNIMVINDQFSKYIQLFALKDRKAVSAVHCLHDFSLRYGIPYKLFSDQDPAYESELVRLFCETLGIKKTRTSGYNPKSNGLTEQSNHTIKNYLTSFVNNEKEWDQWLKELSFAYNTSIHSSTGFSPMELMFGRKVRVPIDLLYNFNSEISGVTSIDQFKSQLQNLYALARENMNARQEKAATYYDKKVLDDPLLVDDKVYVYLPRNKRLKLVPNWYGPFLITKANHPVYHVDIQTHQGTITKTLTRDRLKRVKNPNAQTITLTPPADNTHKNENNNDYDGDSSDSEFEDNRDEPYVNRLRPRPRIGPQRYFDLHAMHVHDL